MSGFGGPGGRQITYKPTPPERGSFPLDHDAECKHFMTSYLKCIKSQDPPGQNNPECRFHAKDYLNCRMEKEPCLREATTTGYQRAFGSSGRQVHEMCEYLGKPAPAERDAAPQVTALYFVRYDRSDVDGVAIPVLLYKAWPRRETRLCWRWKETIYRENSLSLETSAISSDNSLQTIQLSGLDRFTFCATIRMREARAYRSAVSYPPSASFLSHVYDLGMVPTTQLPDYDEPFRIPVLKSTDSGFLPREIPFSCCCIQITSMIASRIHNGGPMADQPYTQVPAAAPVSANLFHATEPVFTWPIELRPRMPTSTEGLPYHTATRPPVEAQRSLRRNSAETDSSEPFSRLKDRLRYSLTPSQHHLLPSDAIQQRTVRSFSKRGQQWRLWRLSFGEFALTIIFCIAFFAILYKYSEKDTISVSQRRIFNALTTAIALALGVNLTASLRSYARMMRWRLLSLSYQPLGTFDTIMGCDSRLNNLKLLWCGGEKGRLFSRLQGYALLWLFVNVLTTILVGMVGLTYNLDVSPELVLTKNGTVLITDLALILTDDYQSSLNAVNGWGLRGFIFELNDSFSPEDLGFGMYSSNFSGHTRYYFSDYNEGKTNDIATWRYVESKASCTDYEVLGGHNGSRTHSKSHPVPEGSPLLHQSSPPVAPGAATCSAFQASSPKDEQINSPANQIEAHLFICNNTISKVADLELYIGSEYQFPDLQARMLAGAIGWSGDPQQDTQQYMTYIDTSDVSFNHTPSATNMADLISSFSIGTIAAGDTIEPGIGRKMVQHGLAPVDAQILHVTWKYCGAILILIPLLHFLTLMAVIVWANKAVIKDDSHLAIAKVYHSLLTELGSHGCMLRGPEIARELGQPMVLYGFVPPTTAHGVGHADCFEIGSGVRVKPSFDEGLYDGNGYGNSISTVGPRRKEKAD